MTREALAVACLMVLGTAAALAGDTLWTRRYNGQGGRDDAARVVLTDASDNVIVVGSCPGLGTGFDITVIKYAPNGARLWVTDIAGPGMSHDEAQAAALGADGSVCVTGITGSFPNYDILTARLNPDGSEAWRATYEGPGGNADCPAGIAVDETDCSFVVGYVTDAAGANTDYVTIKYTPAGETAWTAFYDGARGRDQACAVALGPDGAVYITGTSTQPESHEDFATVKYSSVGDRQWVALYDGPGNAGDFAAALAVDRSGDAYVTGRSATAPPPAGTNHYATVRYDSSGNEQWARRYAGVGRNNEPVALVLGSSAVYVTGKSGRAQGDNDYATVAHALATGDTLWTRRFNGPPEKDDAATAIAVGSNDRVYVTGTSLDWSDRGDFMTLRYSAAGFQEWAARHNSPFDNDEQAVAIAVDSRSCFVVAGNSFGGGNYDMLTVKYDSSAVGGIEEPRPGFPISDRRFSIEPNPIANGFAALRLSGQAVKWSSGLVRVFDAAGRCVVTRSLAIGDWSLGIPLDIRGLSSGVYLVRLDAGVFAATEKLLVQR